VLAATSQHRDSTQLVLSCVILISLGRTTSKAAFIFYIKMKTPPPKRSRFKKTKKQADLQSNGTPSILSA
jgi:hypothetical protein